MRTLKEFEVKEKKVLVRCDFNVPLDKQGSILDDFRIKETIPTIQYLIDGGAKIILMSHLGRPEGKVVEELRLTSIKEKLEKCLDLSVKKSDDCIGNETEELINKMNPGEVLLLENLRFHKEEEEGDLDFAKKLADLGNIYINDAFGASHRAHASIVGIPKYLPSAAGFLLEKEVKVLSELMQNPKKPLIAIIGGIKVETKAKLINKISRTADFILVNGPIKREIEEKKIKFDYPQKILGPIDEIGEGRDVGPETLLQFGEKIKSAKTIFWNGPLGQTENKEFSKGSEVLARIIVESGAFSIVGGGETAEFINRIGLIEKFNHVSTGGGAMLEFLSGQELPGIKALSSGT